MSICENEQANLVENNVNLIKFVERAEKKTDLSDF